MTRSTVPLSRYRALGAAAIAATAVVLTACAPANPTPDSSAGGDLTPIRFVQEWPVADGFWIPWIVADKLGYYEEAGLAVEIITPPNVAATMQFLGTGQADLAFTTSVDIVTARSQGVPVVGIGKYGSNNNWGLMSTTNEPVDPANLPGMLVGTYNDAWSNAQLSIMLGSVGASIDDVTLVTADSSTVPLLVEGQVDVITGITNAEGSELESLGVTDYSIAYSRDYGAPDAPVLMLSGNEEWLAANADATTAFLEATVRGLNYARANPEEAVSIFLETYPDAQSKEFTTLQWDATAALFGEPGAEVTTETFLQSEESWQSVIDVALEYGPDRSGDRRAGHLHQRPAGRLTREQHTGAHRAPGRGVVEHHVSPHQGLRHLHDLDLRGGRRPVHPGARSRRLDRRLPAQPRRRRALPRLGCGVGGVRPGRAVRHRGEHAPAAELRVRSRAALGRGSARSDRGVGARRWFAAHGGGLPLLPGDRGESELPQHGAGIGAAGDDGGRRRS